MAETKRRVKKVGNLSDAAVTGMELNGLGSAEVLEIAKINVDPNYQRDLRHDLVNKIAREYDIVKAGPILVSERKDGSLWCVDGQHRMAGAEQAGETEIFAHVVHGLNQQEEAELRLARNERRSDSAFEKFRTRLVMKDPKAEAMMELCYQHGTPLNLQPNMNQGINALAAAEQIYDIDNAGVWLSRSLKFLTEAYGPPPLGGNEVSMAMLKSVVWFIDRHMGRTGEVRWPEMVERVQRMGSSDIRRKAVAHKAALGGSLWLNYYRALVEIWNFGRTEANKIDWKVQGSILQIGTDSGGPGRRRTRDGGNS